MKFMLYTADCSGNEQNCLYPKAVQVDSAEILSAATAKDHVCASFQNNHRSVADFLACDVIMLDCLGFHQRHRDLLQKQLDVPVLLSNVLIARLAAELLV